MYKHFTITFSGNLFHKGLKLRAMMLASKFGITGSVAEGQNQVVIEAEGDEKDLGQFYRSISIYVEQDNSKNTVQITENHSLSYYEDFIIK